MNEAAERERLADTIERIKPNTGLPLHFSRAEWNTIVTALRTQPLPPAEGDFTQWLDTIEEFLEDADNFELTDDSTPHTTPAFNALKSLRAALSHPASISPAPGLTMRLRDALMWIDGTDPEIVAAAENKFRFNLQSLTLSSPAPGAVEGMPSDVTAEELLKRGDQQERQASEFVESYPDLSRGCLIQAACYRFTARHFHTPEAGKEDVERVSIDPATLPFDLPLPEFKPNVLELREAGITSYIHEDVAYYSKAVGQPHYVDALLAMDDNRLVGVNFWFVPPLKWPDIDKAFSAEIKKWTENVHDKRTAHAVYIDVTAELLRTRSSARVRELEELNEQLLEQIALHQPSVVEKDMQAVMKFNNELLEALQAFAWPPLYVFDGSDDDLWVPTKQPEHWIGGGQISTADFRRARSLLQPKEDKG